MVCPRMGGLGNPRELDLVKRTWVGVPRVGNLTRPPSWKVERIWEWVMRGVPSWKIPRIYLSGLTVSKDGWMKGKEYCVAQTWRGPFANKYYYSLEECCNKLVVSAYHFVAHTIQDLWSPGVWIWLIMETQGWGNWHLKTWKCQISPGLPDPPILGQINDRCISQQKL